MVWQQWTLVAIYTLSALLTVAVIGKPRGPITASTAVLTLISTGAMIALVVSI